MNLAFFDLSNQMREIKKRFDLDPDEDIVFKLGEIDGREVNLTDVVDTLLTKGVVLQADLTLQIAEVPLADASLSLWLDRPQSKDNAP